MWNKDHSLLREVKHNNAGDTLIIKNPGIYFIYSQITFSKHTSSSSLKQGIWSKRPNKDPEEILKSYCSLDPNTPDLCTASLSGVFDLEEEQQLYVTVTNTSLLNKDSCSFGLFKLNWQRIKLTKWDHQVIDWITETLVKHGSLRTWH